MTSRESSTIQLKHPDRTKSAPRISTEKYETVRETLLQAIPKDKAGIPFMQLSKEVESRLSKEVLKALGSVGWYTTVKLDLEARKLIERVLGSQPQRVRRVK
jgi:hypothetical protein